MDIKRVQEIDNNSKHDIYIFLEEKGMREYMVSGYKAMSEAGLVYNPAHNRLNQIRKEIEQLKEKDRFITPIGSKNKVIIQLIKDA